MKKIIYSLFCFAFIFGTARGADFISVCGSGYVLSDHAKIEGINAKECKKLWCYDLETGKPMGNGNTPANGYRATNAPVYIDDGVGHGIECWGERKWCSGEPAGIYDSESGEYTRPDGAAYEAYQSGGCWKWRLTKPECEPGLVAILRGGQWICATQVEGEGGAVSKASSVRRTGAVRRILR